jgi:hypothetical protein
MTEWRCVKVPRPQLHSGELDNRRPPMRQRYVLLFSIQTRFHRDPLLRDLHTLSPVAWRIRSGNVVSFSARRFHRHRTPHARGRSTCSKAANRRRNLLLKLVRTGSKVFCQHHAARSSPYRRPQVAKPLSTIYHIQLRARVPDNLLLYIKG